MLPACPARRLARASAPSGGVHTLLVVLLCLAVAACAAPDEPDSGGFTPGGKKDTKSETDAGAPDVVEDAGEPADAGGGAEDTWTGFDFGGGTGGEDADTGGGGDDATEDTGTGIECQPNQQFCLNDSSFAICNGQGDGYAQGPIECQEGQQCIDSICKQAAVCTPLTSWCDEGVLYKCNQAGQPQMLSCGEGKVCQVDEISDIAFCQTQVCVPGTSECGGTGGQQVFTCADDGLSEIEGDVCTDNDQTCLDGACIAGVCGDGVKQSNEACDAGDLNGTSASNCSDKCEIYDTSCTVAADCNDLPKGDCVLAFTCFFGTCGIVTSNGLLCDDGDACTTADRCNLQGLCKGVPVVCNDGNPCTVDECGPTGCKASNAGANGLGCDDGNPCTQNDSCKLGQCAGGANECQCQVDADCAQFEDGNLCNGTLVCQNTVCIVDKDTVVTCDDSGDTDCVTNACNPQTGTCQAKAASQGTACDDGNACSGPDTCFSGACVGDAVTCDDGNACTIDTCDPKTGCKYTDSSAGCNDGDPCTAGDKCTDGVCSGTQTCGCQTDADCVQGDGSNKCLPTYTCNQGLCEALTPAVTCESSGLPCQDFACDPALGACTPTALPQGEPCSDGNACTKGDVCDGQGSCAGPSLSCDDGNACTDNACDPDLGCLTTFNKELCDDGDFCTTGDVCTAGQCVGKAGGCECLTDADCEPLNGQNKCLGGFTCDPATKDCVFDPTTVIKCDTSGDGLCKSTKCNPANAQCEPVLPPLGTACDDGNPCTIADVCEPSGDCVGKANECDDFNPCTTDSCDPAKPLGCVFDAVASVGDSCDDKNVCTQGETCNEDGFCAASLSDPNVTLTNCDDGNSCTADVCNAQTGCESSVAALPCDDGDACTEGDACDLVSGSCKGGDPKVCNDGDPCTDDACDMAIGCTQTVNNNPCNDGDPCTVGDACGKTGSGIIGCLSGDDALDCDDGDVCTNDSCEPVQGCKYTNVVDTPCDDGNACSSDDFCANGVCGGFPLDCNDENPCTDDVCDPDKGCVYTVAQSTCGVFASCSGGEDTQCVFSKPGGHLMISELYRGKPWDTSDDFVEIYNNSDKNADLEGFAIQIRAADSQSIGDWLTVHEFPAATFIPPGNYMLIGNNGPLPNKVEPDFKSATLELGAAAQVRIFDTLHTLQHDLVGYGEGALGEGSPAPVWPSQRSLERKATATSTADSMYRHGPEWLAGNGYDTGDNSADFIVRLVPEPQSGGKGFVEPACGGTCPKAKTCAGDQCLADTTCFWGCGGGQLCNTAVNECVPSGLGSVKISEILRDASPAQGDDTTAAQEFIELHNSAGSSIDISGMVLQYKTAEKVPFDPWTDVVQFPAGTVMPPKSYYLAASKAWAAKYGDIDILFADEPGIASSGGAVRLWDPWSNVQLDLVGWGDALTFEGEATVNTSVGASLVRKADASSNPFSMSEIGDKYLAGNAHDTNNNKNDIVPSFDPEPQSQRSGVYEPACGGTKCAAGQACSFNPNDEVCRSATCDGTCKAGSACNVYTGQCDITVKISQVGAYGPEVPGEIFGGDNEFIELYNPARTPMTIGSMLIQYRAPASSKWTTVLTNIPASTSIPPRGYWLAVPQNYDPALSEADSVKAGVTSFAWSLPNKGQSAALRIVRSDGSLFVGNKNYADLVAWGGANIQAFAEGGKPATGQQDLQGSIVRKASLRATVETMTSGDHADSYNGSGFDTNHNGDDWLVLPTRAPRHSGLSPATP